MEGKRGGSYGGERPRGGGPANPGPPLPLPAPVSGVQESGAPVAAPAPVQQIAKQQRNAPKPPPAPASLPASPTEAPRQPGPPPTPAFQRPADAVSQYLRGAQLGAFDPRQRGRADVQEALARLGSDVGELGPAVSAPLGAPGVAGIGPTAQKQFEDEERLMGILQVLR